MKRDNKHDDKHKEKQGLRPELWLEHVEDEIEPTCQAESMDDLDLLLKNSEADRATYESLLRVRTLVKNLDDVALPESGEYYKNLHEKIMAAIDEEAQSSRSTRAALRSRFAWPRFAVRPQAALNALGMTMMLAIAAFVGLHQKSNVPSSTSSEQIASHEQQVEERFERKLAAVDSQTGADFAHDMGSFEGEEDFLTEAAAARLKHITKRQADELIRSLM